MGQWTSVAIDLPVVAVLVVGLILAGAGDETLPPRTGGRVVAGCCVLLVGAVAEIGWSLATPWIGVHAGAGWSRLAVLADMALTVVQVVGLALLLAAALAPTLDEPDRWGDPDAPYPEWGADDAVAPQTVGRDALPDWSRPPLN